MPTTPNTARLYSAALCRGLIEARFDVVRQPAARACIPRLYAAASLKLLSVTAADRG